MKLPHFAEDVAKSLVARVFGEVEAVMEALKAADATFAAMHGRGRKVRRRWRVRNCF